MLSSSDAPRPDPVPLVVDLDGTLIRTDLIWEHLARLLRRNPFWLLPVLVWWMRGRAFLKRQLVRRIKIDPATLPYHEPFLNYLRAQKAAGRKIILATASDLQMAQPVAGQVGLFDEVLASDGKTNLRRDNKLKALTARFGERGFDYAGNSPDDLVVWRGAREAIVVNASPVVRQRAATVAKVSASFNEGYSPIAIQKRFLAELFIHSGYLLAALGGLLMTAAFPNVGIAGAAWIAPALILFAAQKKPPGDAFRVGYVAGLVHFLSSLYWLLLIPVAGFPILGWVALSAFMAFYPALWTWLLAGKIGTGTWTRRNLWSLTGAAAWVGLEMIRAHFLGGFPWNLLGTSQYQLTPLIQIASITGVYGVSFLVVWVSLSLFSAAGAIFSKPDARFAWQPEVFLPLLVVAILFAYGSFKMRPAANPSSPALRITLVQPSVPQTLIWDSGANSNRFEQLLALTETALTNQTDLLIWPEAALPDFDNASYMAITNLIRSHHVWMIFNADDVRTKTNPTGNDPYDYFNSAFFFNPDGGFVDVYHKRKLVIFGEYIPLVRWLPFVKWFTPITGGYEAGDQPGMFEINRRGETSSSSDAKQITIGLGGISPSRTVNAAPLICFEDMFPQTARQSVRGDTDFLVNLTNDGWFGEGAEQWQQAAAGIFRAVENGVPLVRCCNNGVTCWIDAHGQVRQVFKDATGSIYGVGTMTLELPLPDAQRPPTFYNRHGDWFGWSCVTITAALLLAKISRRKIAKTVSSTA